MNPRKKALLEAALMCSRFADNLACQYTGTEAAADLAERLAQLADSPLHYYPPGKAVIDLGQDSKNTSPAESTVYFFALYKKA